ncbi:hypothetical protein [Weissella muntiaci]|jgi:hypothetical protein|nr:hypothetical protein [Weissella muntiaci]
MPKLLKLIITGFVLIVIGVIILTISAHAGGAHGVNWSGHGFVVVSAATW